MIDGQTPGTRSKALEHLLNGPFSEIVLNVSKESRHAADKSRCCDYMMPCPIPLTAQSINITPERFKSPWTL